MKIFFARTFAIALVLILSATGLWAAGSEEEPAAAADKQYVTDPTTGKVVTAPEYGGTFTFIKTGFPPNIDPAAGATIPTRNVGDIIGFVNEKLGIGDWATDRDIFDFTTVVAPEFILKGLLAESWDISPDRLTYTFHLRQGVHYHVSHR